MKTMPKNTKQNKQSHVMTQQTSLMGKLLIAMPDMGDQRFDRAVILICAHDKDGAMGIVLNHALEQVDTQALFKELDIDADAGASLPVFQGGPVEPSRGFMLHSADYAQKDTVPLSDGLCVTGTTDVIRAVAKGQGPKQSLFALGYAGWSAGQLEAEIQENAWLITESDADMIFNTPRMELWGKCLKQLGIDPLMLASHTGHA
tara:strand:- start:342 stop:950 length:609 start_codon:yes stop_codon:yes gene_type:complete